MKPKKQAAWQLMQELAGEACTGAFRPILHPTVWVGCGRCPTCRARAILGKVDELPEPKVLCVHCGLTGRKVVGDE